MFSGIVTGHEGAQFVNHASQQYDLGTIMVIDDRSYHYVEMGAADSVAGSLYQAEAPSVHRSVLPVAAAAAVGSREVTLTLKAAAATTASDYRDGYVHIDNLKTGAAGFGRAYKIKDNVGAAASGTETITLKAAGGLNEALTTSNTCELVKHPCMTVVIAARTAVVVGLAVNVISATQFGWLQIRGPASVQFDGATAVNEGYPVEMSTNHSGEVMVHDVSTNSDAAILGVFAGNNVVDETFAFIALDIPGFGI